jgi:hypothetical protein
MATRIKGQNPCAMLYVVVCIMYYVVYYMLVYLLLLY